MLNSITDDLRKNIVDMGKYAVQQYKNLKKEVGNDLITAVTGSGLLYWVQLSKSLPVVSMTGAEMALRNNGIGVIHGGEKRTSLYATLQGYQSGNLHASGVCQGVFT